MCIKFRIDGVLTQAMPPIGKEHHSTIISRIKVMSELDISERRVPQDGRFRVKYGNPERPIDFRVSIMPSIHGEDAVLARTRQGVDEREVSQAGARRSGL